MQLAEFLTQNVFQNRKASVMMIVTFYLVKTVLQYLYLLTKS